jgi:hypothetical protein
MRLACPKVAPPGPPRPYLPDRYRRPPPASGSAAYDPSELLCAWLRGGRVPITEDCPNRLEAMGSCRRVSANHRGFRAGPTDRENAGALLLAVPAVGLPFLSFGALQLLLYRNGEGESQERLGEHDREVPSRGRCGE